MSNDDDDDGLGRERYEKARQAEIDSELANQKSRLMRYSGNIHVDYVNEHLDCNDNENVSFREWGDYIERAERGAFFAPDWYRPYWEHAMERQKKK